MACITAPVSPESGSFRLARILAIICAVLVAVGGLAAPALAGTPIAQLLAVVGTTGMWIYNAVLLHTTWVCQDGDLAPFDVAQVRGLRATAFAKTWLFYDVAATLCILIPLVVDLAVAPIFFQVAVRGAFLLRIPSLSRTPLRMGEEQERSSGDVEERYHNTSPTNASVEPSLFGKSAREAGPSSQAKPAPHEGSFSSPQEKYLDITADSEAAPV